MPSARPIAVLAERDEVLGALLAFVERARHGQGGVAVVAGPAGIGQTAVLGALTDVARVDALHAAGSHLEREVPSGVVVHLLEGRDRQAPEEERGELFAGAAGLARPLLEEGSRASGASGLWQLVHGLYWVLSNLAERAPRLLVVDDVQWADVPSV